jgi:predicted PurR-regulated permease PerM
MTRSQERLISKPVFQALVGIVVVGTVLYFLRGVLAPILLAFLLAYAFNPLVEFLTRYRFPRPLACTICLLIIIMIFVGLIALIFPALQHELQQIAKRMPAYLDRIRESAVPWIEETFGIELPKTIDETLAAARTQIGDRVVSFAGPVVSLLGNILSSTLSFLVSLIYLIIIPMFTYYFLQDYHKITGWFVDLVPPRRREKTLSIMGEVDVVLAGFLRGQLTVCSILATIYCILLSIVGVPAAITIGVVAGLFNMVPYLGTATGIILSCLFLLLEGASWTSYIAVLAIFGGVSITDGLFMTPRILGKKLGLAPVAVILAVLAFGELFGFLGVLMAIPVTAVGKVLAKHLLKAYKDSRAYRKEAPGAQEEEAP